MLRTNNVKEEKNVRNSKTNVGADAHVNTTKKTNHIGVGADASVRPYTKANPIHVGVRLDEPNHREIHKNCRGTGHRAQEPAAITLVALIITVIILIILAGITINLALGQNGIFTKSKQAVDKYKDAVQNEQEHLDDTYRELEGINSKEYNLDEGVNKPKLTEGMIPIKYDTSKSKWVICEESDKDWYNYKEDKKWANVMLSDGKYTSKEPVGTEKAKATVGTEVADDDLGSMFVWIPRYAYSIKEYKTEKNGTEGTTQNITDVTFLVGTTNKDINAKTYPTDYKTEDAKVGQATPKIVHPAFTFGGEKLTGIWVAKFEASMAEDNKNSTSVEDNNNTSKTLKVVPNVESWRHIQIGNMFKNCLDMKNETSTYGLTTSTDSHLMKNIEWGAVAYLCSSQYGTTPKQNTRKEQINGSNNYKIWAAEGDYKTKTDQSTTGNETGIYDMNGGAWEYVAAYWDNRNSKLSYYGTSDIFPSNSLDNKYTKYWDKYEVSEKEIELAKDTTFWNSGSEKNSDRKKITDERYELMENKKGDAMYEVIKDYSSYVRNESNGWIWDKEEPWTGTDYGRSYYNSDCVLIGNTSLPFLNRGGGIWDGTSAGVFASYGDDGDEWFLQRFSSCIGCPLAL